ncbi:MAG: hypothetical protein AAGM67_20255, partial [Bacteroidota bacterium]
KKSGVSRSDKTKKILHVFVHNAKQKTTLLKKSLFSADVRSDGYSLIEIGDFQPKDRDRIVIIPTNPDLIEAFYIDFIELEPK